MAQLNISPSAPNVEVRQISHTIGTGVFAKSALSPGDTVIAVEAAMFVALDAERLGDTCYECYRREGEIPIEMQLGFEPCPALWTKRDPTEVKLKSCAGCRIVRYCGKSCQKSSWTAHHSLECSIFKTWYPKQLPNHIRAVLRVLLLRNKGRVSQNDWEAFMACMSHMDGLKNGEERAIFERMIKATKGLMSFDIEEKVIGEVLMRLKVNSITLQSPLHEPLGLAVHPLIARVNHSCDPNCHVRCLSPNDLPKSANDANPGSIILAPLRNIAAGEQITIPYVDGNWPVHFRRQELQERYYFTCNCVTCVKQLDETSKLEASVDPERQSALKSIQNNARTFFGRVVKREQQATPANRSKDLVFQIRALFAYDKDWDLGLYPFPQLLHQLILTHLDMQSFVPALRLATVLHFDTDPKVHTSDVHPMRLTHTLLVIKLLGALLEKIPPLSVTSDAKVEQLSKEVDLNFWNQTLTERLIESANKTWKELPWPWLDAVVKQVATQGSIGPGPFDEVKVAREQERMKEFCAQALEPLKHA